MPSTKYQHHDLVFEVSNSWLSMSGISNFTPDSDSYKPDIEQAGGAEIIFVSITDVAPAKERAKNKGVFCDNEETSAKQRVLRIFNWIVAGAEIEPVRVSLNNTNAQYKYKLIEGCHRFHCSIVAGYAYIPAILGTDINDI